MIGLHPDEQQHEELMRRRRESSAKAATLRARLGLAIRRKPGRLPSAEAKAFASIVERSELAPRELVDALLSALLDAHPEASVTEAARWLSASAESTQKGRGFGDATQVYSLDAAIIGGSGHEALAGAPGPARTEGGSDR